MLHLLQTRRYIKCFLYILLRHYIVININLVVDTQLKETIANAFVAAGLVVGDDKDPTMKMAILKRNAALAEVFATDERDIATLRQRLGEDLPDVIFSPAPNGKTVATVQISSSISPNHEIYSLVLNATADKYFSKSYVIPAQELAAELDRQRSMSQQLGSSLESRGKLLDCVEEQNAPVNSPMNS
jgi:hypothetical protein